MKEDVDQGKENAAQNVGLRNRFRMLSNPSVVKPFIISAALMFFQQFSGINAVIFYTVSIFRDAGSTVDRNLATIIVGIVQFLSILLVTAMVIAALYKLYVINQHFLRYRSTDMEEGCY
jgi:facilitated trehalose transporter